ncbi:MAG: type II toxin-antitoxin system RelE family toxin [Candidatus Geothermincolia bacterium]
MASYSFFIKPSAAKEIEVVPKKDRLKIIDRIHALAISPRPPGCEMLSGDDKYRVRQGNYRILYTINDYELVVSVVKVWDRRDASKTTTRRSQATGSITHRKCDLCHRS